MKSNFRKRTRERLGFLFFLSPAIIGFSLLTIYPFFSSLWMSFTNRLLYYPGDAVFIGLKNYEYLLTKYPLFWPALKNSLIYAFWSVILSNIIAILSAQLLTRNLRGTNIFRVLFYIPSILPAISVVVMFSFIFDPSHGIINRTLLALGMQPRDLPLWLSGTESALSTLVIISLWGFGGKMIVNIAGINAIPKTCYEAAEIDGANAFTQFFKITLPLLTPSIFYGLITSIIAGVQVFTEAFVGSGGVVSFYVPVLYNMAYTGTYQMGLASAMAWILFVIVAILVFLNMFLSKFYVYYEY